MAISSSGSGYKPVVPKDPTGQYNFSRPYFEKYVLNLGASEPGRRDGFNEYQRIINQALYQGYGGNINKAPAEFQALYKEVKKHGGGKFDMATYEKLVAPHTYDAWYNQSGKAEVDKWHQADLAMEQKKQQEELAKKQAEQARLRTEQEAKLKEQQTALEKQRLAAAEAEKAQQAKLEQQRQEAARQAELQQQQQEKARQAELVRQREAEAQKAAEVRRQQEQATKDKAFKDALDHMNQRANVRREEVNPDYSQDEALLASKKKKKVGYDSTRVTGILGAASTQSKKLLGM